MDDNNENGWHLLLQNGHLSLRMTVDDLDISKDTVWKIVIENVKIRKVFLCFVPHALTAEQEEDRVLHDKISLRWHTIILTFFKKKKP